MADSKAPEAAKLKSEQQKNIRETNIIAAQAVANVVRTSLGPCGMDKMVCIEFMDLSAHLIMSSDLEISILRLNTLS